MFVGPLPVFIGNMMMIIIFLSIACSHVKCGVVGDEIYVYFHILCVVIC